MSTKRESDFKFEDIAHDVSKMLGPQPLVVRLVGTAIALDKLRTSVESPLHDVLKDRTSLKIVKSLSELKKASSGVTYSVMGFKFKVYEVGDKDAQSRMVAAPIEPILEDISYNGRKFESIAITATHNRKRFDKVKNSGFLSSSEVITKDGVELLMYTTNFSRDTVRFMALLDESIVDEPEFNMADVESESTSMFVGSAE